MSDSRETPSPQVSLETGPESTDRKTGWSSRGRNWGQRTGTSLQLVIQTLVLRGVIAPPHLLWPYSSPDVPVGGALTPCRSYWSLFVSAIGRGSPQSHRAQDHSQCKPPSFTRGLQLKREQRHTSKKEQTWPRRMSRWAGTWHLLPFRGSVEGWESDSSCPAPMDPRSPGPHLPHRSCLSAADSTSHSKEIAEARIITWLVVQWLTSVSSIDIVFLTSIIFLTFKCCES